MKKALILSVVVFSFFSASCARMLAKGMKLPNKPQGYRSIKNVKVPMRDGIRLATDIYLPAKGNKHPVILCRLPYGKRTLGAMPMVGKLLAGQGYAFVVQDTRGRFDSEGEFFPMIDEAEDGEDTVKWLRTVPWFDGRLGTWGASYFGYTQWALAPSAPELKAMYLGITSANMTEVAYGGGEVKLMANLSFASFVQKRKGKFVSPCRQYYAAWTLPLIDAENDLGSDLKFFNDSVSPQKMLSLYDKMDYEDKYEKVTGAAYMQAGWYDIFIGPQLKDFVKLRKRGQGAAKHSKIVIGPWTHLGNMGGDGSVSFGKLREKPFDFTKSVEWFDLWIKEEHRPIALEPPIKMFVMGANYWREEYEWPLERTEFTPYYLHSNGRANSIRGSGRLDINPPDDQQRVDRFDYDPMNPVLTLGGNNLIIPIPSLCNVDISALSGAVDQRPVEARDDVLVFSTPALENDVEVSGPIKVVLYASSSAPDTDFTAKLVDVHPDGKAVNLADGLIRALYREGLRSQAKPIKRGTVYKYEIDLWDTSNVFRAGHKIRVEISSSNFPRYSRNLNILGAQELAKSGRIAHQVIYHDKEHPSHILLPIIP